MHSFEGESANQVWLHAVAAFGPSSEQRIQSSRDGDTSEILHASFCIHNPVQRWVVSRRPRINPAFALAETVWILRGRQDSAFLNFWNSQLPRFCGTGAKYDGAYGYRLRRQFGLDQIERAYRALQSTPESRQVVLQIWDAHSDLPDTSGTPASPDVPCNICSLLKIRNNRLEWTQILRSNDLFLGVPYNFVQFTCLQEIMAGWLHVEPGDYVQFSDSLHVYQRDWARLEASVSTDNCLDSDRLALPKAESDDAFMELEADMLTLMNDSITPTELEQIARRRRPPAFRNISLVLTAYVARKRRWSSAVAELINECTNPVLRELCAKWCEPVALAS